ncbi:MAG TPA: transcriptional regulator, partial [Firmicutes bacterium]|nr:transcriptional regulator [Bacillota bacterium]
YSLDDDTIDKTKQFHAITSDKENCICRGSKNCCKECEENE